MSEDLKQMKGMSEDEARARLRLIQIKKEKLRASNVESGQAIREDMAQRGSEAIQDIPVSAAQSFLLEYGDELAGATVGAYKKATGDSRPYDEIYNEAKQAVLGEVKGARERSPVATFFGDAVMPNPLKFFKATKWVGPVTTSLVQGYGATEGKDAGEQAMDVGTAGAMGLAAKVGGKVVESAFKNPQATEARFLGLDSSSKKATKEVGARYVKKIEESLDNLRNKGFFSAGKTKFSVKNNKWRGNGTVSKMKAPSLEEVSAKMDDALNKASSEVEQRLYDLSPDIPKGGFKSKEVKVGTRKKLDKYAMGTVEEEIKRRIKPSIPSGALSETDINSFDNGRLKEILNDNVNSFGVTEESDIVNTVKESFQNLHRGDKHFTLLDLQNEKKRIYNILSGEYGKENIKDSSKSVLKDLARMYKDMVNDISKDPKIIDLNNTMEDIMSVKGAVSSKIENKFFESPSKGVKGSAYGGMGFRMERAAENIIDPTRPYRAKVGRMYEGMPDQLKSLLEGQGSALPGRVNVPFMQGAQDESGREPQSIPEQIVRTPLPRSTDEIVQKKDFVLAKVAQQAPDLYDSVKDIIENDPESLADVLPALSKAAPHLFVKDKYDRIDNRILDPQKKELARRDTMLDQTLSNTEKAKIINELNRSGVFNDR